jgi:hypothetical protein
MDSNRPANDLACPFLELPPELRLRIYEDVYPGLYHCRLIVEQESDLIRLGPIIEDQHLVTFPSRLSSANIQMSWSKSIVSISRLYLASRTIYRETLPIIYDRTVFHILCYGMREPCAPGTYCGRWGKLADAMCSMCENWLERLECIRVPVLSPADYWQYFCVECSLRDEEAMFRCIRRLGSIARWPGLQFVRHVELRLSYHPVNFYTSRGQMIGGDAPVDSDMIVQATAILRAFESLDNSLEARTCIASIALPEHVGISCVRSISLAMQSYFQTDTLINGANTTAKQLCRELETCAWSLEGEVGRLLSRDTRASFIAQSKGSETDWRRARQAIQV